MTRFKTPLLIALAGALLVTMVPEAQARERGERPSFGQLDTNGDGSLTQEELAAFRESRGDARFDAVDANGDGALSRAELEAQAAERTAQRIDRIMERDADGDGLLNRDELATDGPRGTRAGQFFDRVDTDGNGALSEAEWDAIAQRRARR